MKKVITFLVLLFLIGSMFAQAPVKRNANSQTFPTNKKVTSPRLQKTTRSGYVNGHMAVDLGLSVRWADCNIGANCKEDDGRFFAYGRPDGKIGDGANSFANICKTEHDMASKNWGGSWRLPTKKEMQELLAKCSWKMTSINGIKGYIVKASNGNSIFLPLSGYSSPNGERYDYGKVGAYWIGELVTETWAYGAGYPLFLDPERKQKPSLGIMDPNNGCSVRAVTE